MVRALLPQNANARGSIYMAIAMACFVSNDTCVKAVGTTLPLGEIMGLRGIIAVTLIASYGLLQGAGSQARLLFHPRVLIRASLDLIATVLFLTALLHMPLANLTAVLQVVPLAVAFMSRIIFGEHVGYVRAGAIALGFVGVLFIVKPTPADFSFYDALALGIVFAIAIRDLVTRTVTKSIPSVIVALANASFVMVGGWAMSLTQGFQMPTAKQFSLLSLAAVFLSCGYVAMVATLRTGALSATAPFRYTILLFAIFYGLVFFGEAPDHLSILGMLLIVAAGIVAARIAAKGQP